MWEEPKWYDKSKCVDVNAKMRKLKGELSEQKARVTLAEFLQYNLTFTTEILTGFKMHPRQAVLMKAWFDSNFNLSVWGRGSGKSTLIGLFACLYGIFNANTHILIVSSNFRSSRRILENIEKIANTPDGRLLKDCFKGDMSRRGDIFKWTFWNESTITCVPLSNGDGLRGLRANVLIIDEALLVPSAIIENILKPFLVASSNIKEKLKMAELEDRLIAMGKMKEEDRKQFGSTSKMILLSSASYQWEDLYKTYQVYLKKAIEEDEKERREGTYSVTQLSYEAVPPQILDKAILKDIHSGNTPQSTIDREYRSIFTQGSDGYYSIKKITEICSVKPGNMPALEIYGSKDAEYVLGIDPSFSSSETSDHFAMSLLKIVKKGEKRIGMLVHSYAVAGGDLKDHIAYLYYLLNNFNIVYIAIDSSGGDSNEFINSSNNSALFKSAGIELRDIEAEYAKDDVFECIRQVRKSYNREARRIVQKQAFNSTFQRYANEHLQACIDYGNIIFAGPIAAVEGLAEEIVKNAKIKDLLDSHKGHSEFKGEGPYYFIETQDSWLDMTKKELALIEVDQTTMGHQSWDLPATMKRSKAINRSRKDNYSSLLLANWGLKLYLASQEMPEQKINTTFSPILV